MRSPTTNRLNLVGVLNDFLLFLVAVCSDDLGIWIILWSAIGLVVVLAVCVVELCLTTLSPNPTTLHALSQTIQTSENKQGIYLNSNLTPLPRQKRNNNKSSNNNNKQSFFFVSLWPHNTVRQIANRYDVIYRILCVVVRRQEKDMASTDTPIVTDTDRHMHVLASFFQKWRTFLVVYLFVLASCR